MKKAYVNGVILDGSKDMEPLRGMVILTEGDKISAVADQTADISGYELVDLGGRYIMPGLVDLHVHIPSSGKPKKGQTDYAKLYKLLSSSELARSVIRRMDESYVKQELLSGTTTIRALGGVMDFDTKLRDKIERGEADGPRILAADYAVSVPGGHMTGSVAMPVYSSRGAAEMVDELVKNKPDQIKLMITGGVLDSTAAGEPGQLKMPEEYVKAAVERAHSYGLPVAAHAEGTEGMVIALRSGVDTIEHGGKPTPEAIELFKQTGAALIATLSPAIRYHALKEKPDWMSDTEYLNGKALFGNMLECIKACREAGIRVGLGTDTGCPYVTHYDTWRELYWYTKYAGSSPKEALYTATKLNAEICGRGDEFGSIEPGKSADMIVTKGDPLSDIKALREVSMVVFRGKIYDSPKLKRIRAVDRFLDSAM